MTGARAKLRRTPPTSRQGPDVAALTHPSRQYGIDASHTSVAGTAHHAVPGATHAPTRPVAHAHRRPTSNADDTSVDTVDQKQSCKNWLVVGNIPSTRSTFVDVEPTAPGGAAGFSLCAFTRAEKGEYCE